jgi:hypothetical protein
MGKLRLNVATIYLVYVHRVLIDGEDESFETCCTDEVETGPFSFGCHFKDGGWTIARFTSGVHPFRK